MTEPALAHPGVRFPPPLLFVAGVGLAALLDRRWPLRFWTGDPPAAPLVLGGILAAAGLLWIAWGMLTFHRARTGILPIRPASRVVDVGPYRFGRNPMYLGMAAAYGGAALWLGSWWAVLLFPLVIALLLRFVIRREERYLSHAFGADYEAYCRRVPRWFSLRR